MNTSDLSSDAFPVEAPARVAAGYRPPHIAGDAGRLTPLQRELVDLAARLGRERFAPRADRHDREATFPRENYEDLREAGLLGICVPRAHGGLGADFATYALVAAELGRHCGATALSFNMHVSASLWMGPVADALDMTDAQRREHDTHRALHGERMARQGLVYSQPFSEGGAAAAGKAPWGTVARKVEGGYVVNGRKIFASRADAAQMHGVLCTLDRPGATLRDSLYLAIPARRPGSRGTASRAARRRAGRACTARRASAPRRPARRRSCGR